MATYRPAVLMNMPDRTLMLAVTYRFGVVITAGYPEVGEAAPMGAVTPSHWAYRVLGSDPDSGLMLATEDSS